MRKFVVVLLSTFFYAGYFPFIPGTFASALGVVVYLFVRQYVFLYTGTVIFLVTLGFIYCGQAERLLGRKDPRSIVLDEIAGMLISLLFVPYSLAALVCGFLLFRLLDTLKPYPAARLQHQSGSLGIMADDIVAGLYTNILLQAVFRFASLKVS